MKRESLPVLHPIAGFRLGTTSAGIRKPGRPDLVVMTLEAGTTCAAVFTRNEFCAAPVIVAREHLGKTAPSCLIVNTGNANAGTGADGLADARDCCVAAAGLAKVVPEAVLPFSTGVIGEPLAVDRLIAGLPDAFARLSEDGWAEAATGIMTTDTVPKGASRRIEVDGRTVTVTGIAKGSGMIRPDMATMLAFIATDAAIDTPGLQRCLSGAVERSFNRITVDGDTSTNDACILAASGKVSAPRISSDAHLALFGDAVTAVAIELAQAIVRDGEGATRFVTVTVEQGADRNECLQVAYTIAHSPLVKTALFAGDPNWGRILAAVGRAGIGGLAIERVQLYLDDVCIVRNGGRAADYREEEGERVLARSEFEIRVVLGRGERREQVWTCDLTYDYVRINAEYRT